MLLPRPQSKAHETPRGGVVLVSGAAGLVGAAAARAFAQLGAEVVGVDNDSRRAFFGDAASTAWSRRQLESTLPRYRHLDVDIRDGAAIERVFAEYSESIQAVVHCAAQPSHDWAATAPQVDFAVNANGTLNLLEAARQRCPDAAFVFTSTNKVYGDAPNRLPLRELASRWEPEPGSRFAEHGIDESMPIDQAMHSLFGVSKTAADLMVQEYGRYFGMKTVCFRGGCLTGPDHAGAEQHGFLAYLMHCARTGTPYVVRGHKGKQVRDNIHCDDLAACFLAFVKRPRIGAVYNIGGGRRANCSLLEAAAMCEQITGRAVQMRMDAAPRQGDHIWWISDTRRFERDYPDWRPQHGLFDTLVQIHDAQARRATSTSATVAATPMPGPAA